MKVPEFPALALIPPDECSWEARREKREALRQFHDDRRVCDMLSNCKGFERIWALKGQGGKDGTV